MSPVDPPAEKVAGAPAAHAATDETNAAIDNEHNMTVRQSLRFWWKAIVFSFIISLCVIMEGYDTSLMNNFFPFPAFKNRFGDEIDPDGGRVVSSRWQTIILNGTQVSRAPGPADSPAPFRLTGASRCPGRLHRRPRHQRLHLRVAGIQEDHGRQHGLHDGRHLYPLLLHRSAHVSGRWSGSGAPLGRLPDARHLLCRRSLPNPPARCVASLAFPPLIWSRPSSGC